MISCNATHGAMLRIADIAPHGWIDVSAPATPKRRRAKSSAWDLATPQNLRRNPGLSALGEARLADAAAGSAEAAFSAGAELALFRRVARAPGVQSGRGLRPAWRLRADEGALRDAEHLTPPGALARARRPPSSAVSADFSTRLLRLDAATLGLAAETCWKLRTAAPMLAGTRHSPAGDPRTRRVATRGGRGRQPHGDDGLFGAPQALLHGRR